MCIQVAFLVITLICMLLSPFVKIRRGGDDDDEEEEEDE